VQQHTVVIDSGAGVHVSPNRDFIRNMRPLDKSVRLSGVFGRPEIATHFGEGAIVIGTHTLHLPGVIYMPSIKDTLLSYVRLIREGHHISFDNGGGVFVDKNESIRLPLNGTGNILSFTHGRDAVPINALTRAAAAATVPVPAAPERPKGARDEITTAAPITIATDEMHIAHARYGHLCARKLSQLAKTGAAPIDSASLVRMSSGNKRKLNLYERTCDACQLGKMARLKFATQLDHLAERPNDKVVADVCGPIWTVKNADDTLTKFYLSTITDVYSRHLEILIIESKDQASDHCISYLHASRISTRNDMQHFHTDGGTEYNKFERVAISRGTKVTRTPVHTPQRNGIAERKNRTIMEMSRALLLHANLPAAKYWRYAVETAVIIHNRCTIVGEYGKTMHELFTGHAPDLSFMRVFGCDAFVRTPLPQSKFEPRSQKGVFIGYDIKRELCYRIQVGDTIVVSRDVEFVENSFTVGRKSSADAPTAATRNAHDTGMETIREGSAAAEVMELGGDASIAGADSPSPSTFRRLSIPSASSVATTRIPVRSDGVASLTDEKSTAVDARTRKRLASALAEEVAREPSNNGNTRPKRERKRARQTGLNLDDFGTLRSLCQSHLRRCSRLRCALMCCLPHRRTRRQQRSIHPTRFRRRKFASRRYRYRRP
jgi:hypothetical protein